MEQQNVKVIHTYKTKGPLDLDGKSPLSPRRVIIKSVTSTEH
jgi:hypothetical protein